VPSTNFFSPTDLGTFYPRNRALRADEIPAAFMELQMAIHEFAVDLIA